MKISFDLDSTLFTQGTPIQDYRDSTPIPDRIGFVNKLFDEGHEIYIFTARHFKHFVYTESALKSAGLKYHGLILNKPAVELYVDDRGFRLNLDDTTDELYELINKLKE